MSHLIIIELESFSVESLNEVAESICLINSEDKDNHIVFLSCSSNLKLLDPYLREENKSLLSHVNPIDDVAPACYISRASSFVRRCVAYCSAENLRNYTTVQFISTDLRAIRTCEIKMPSSIKESGFSPASESLLQHLIKNLPENHLSDLKRAVEVRRNCQIAF